MTDYDRQKTLAGMDACTDYRDCKECPYDAKYDRRTDCMYALINDMAEMIDELKQQEAQEPRVMTVGDLYGEDMGFYECKHEECVWPVLIARGGPDDDGTVGIIRKDAFEIKADCGLINQTWRIWTAYPTDEQREAVKWDD